MKRKISLLVTIALVVVMAMTALVACGKDPDTSKVVSSTDTQVIVEVISTEKDEKLIDVLNELQTKKKLTFTTKDSEFGPFITSINGKANDNTHFWMIYTDDTANSNAEWGKVTVEGKEYTSATLGISALPVKAGCHYIFSYEGF